jgi:hypothetical protein
MQLFKTLGIGLIIVLLLEHLIIMKDITIYSSIH